MLATYLCFRIGYALLELFKDLVSSPTAWAAPPDGILLLGAADWP